MAWMAKPKNFRDPPVTSTSISPGVVPGGEGKCRRLHIFAKNLADECDAFLVVVHTLLTLGQSLRFPLGQVGRVVRQLSIMVAGMLSTSGFCISCSGVNTL